MIWQQGRAICCGLPAACPSGVPPWHFNLPRLFTASPGPASQLTCFHSPSFWQDFWRRSLSSIPIPPWLGHRWLRGSRQGAEPQLLRAASCQPRAGGALLAGSRQGTGRGNVPACPGEPKNSSEENLRRLYLLRGSWQEQLAGGELTVSHERTSLRAQGSLRFSCRSGQTSLPRFTSE